MHSHITYYTQSSVYKSGFYERISSSKFLMDVCRICQRGQLFWGIATRDVAKRLLGGFGGMLPRINFLNGAIWCVLEHIFINFSLSNSLKIFIFYTKIMINCSHVLAMGSSSMIHCPLIIFY